MNEEASKKEKDHPADFYTTNINNNNNNVNFGNQKIMTDN